MPALKWQNEAQDCSLSREQLIGVLENMDQCIWVCSLPSYRVEYASREATASLFGLSAVAFYSDPALWLTLVHDRDRLPVLAARAKCVQEGKADVKVRLKMGSGEFSLFHLCFRKFEEKPGKVESLILSFSRLQEVKNEEEGSTEALEHRVFELNAIIANSPGIVCQFSLPKIGDPFLSFLGGRFLSEWAVGKNKNLGSVELFLSFIDQEDKACLLEKLKQSSISMLPLEWEGRLKIPSGGTRWIRGKLVPRIQENAVLVWDGVLLDETSEKEMQMALSFERARALKNAKLASVGEMSAGIAHEINNPLAIISGTLGLLKGCMGDSEKFDSRVDSISRAVMRISKIVRGLKRYARIDAKRVEHVWPMKQIAEEALALFDSSFKRHGISLNCFLETEGLILCDQIEMEQVLINLISNSVDAVKGLGERWIKIHLFPESNEIVLHVMDSGPGIFLPLQEKIFDPFFTTKDVGEGTGLGLSIVKGILDDHKGTIEVIEAPFTCFEIRIPASKKAREKAPGSNLGENE